MLINVQAPKITSFFGQKQHVDDDQRTMDKKLDKIMVRQKDKMSSLHTKMRFERKTGVDKLYRRYNFIPDMPEKFQGCVHGATIVIKDVRRGRKLFLIQNFGSFIGQRMNFTNSLCFPQPAEENAITGKQWNSANSRCQISTDGLELVKSLLSTGIFEILAGLCAMASLLAVTTCYTKTVWKFIIRVLGSASNCKKVLLLASLDHASMKGVDFSMIDCLKSFNPEVALFTGWNWKKSRVSDLNTQFSESDNED
uniref:Uncharacterized protein n=1 Tax=Ditylenchus dipsaci TaxID=166011 RepID=A0A915CQF6_9BILA